MTSLKFTYEKEIRRIFLEKDEEKSLSYSELLDHLLGLFPALAGQLGGKIISLTYEDDDGDTITCSSDVELEEALRVMREEEREGDRERDRERKRERGREKKITLRFGVKLLEDASLPPSSSSSSAFSPSCGSVHSGVTCDECSLSPILGVRYKCAVRSDFDLCERCEAKKQQPYPMIKIVDPSQAPEILIFSLRDGQRNEEGFPYGHHGGRHWPRGFRHHHGGPPPPHHPFGVGPHGHHHPPPHHHPHRPCDPSSAAAPAGEGEERERERGECPLRRGGGGRGGRCERGERERGGGGGSRWGRRLERWANDFVKDSSPVVAPFLAAMDSVVASALGVPPSPPSSSSSPSVPSSVPSREGGENEREKKQREEEEEEKMLEEVLLREASAAVPSKNTSDIEDQLLESAIMESLTINNTTNNEEKKNKKSAIVDYVETSKPAVPTLPKPALRFVRDGTFPDGTSVQPGAIFRKTWRVRNDGPHPWPEGCRLVNVGGDILSLSPSLASCSVSASASVSLSSSSLAVERDGGGESPLLVSLSPEEEGEVSVSLLAPQAPGMYTTYYRAQTKEKAFFGQRLWAAIVVVDVSSSSSSSAVNHQDEWVNIASDSLASSSPPPQEEGEREEEEVVVKNTENENKNENENEPVAVPVTVTDNNNNHINVVPPLAETVSPSQQQAAAPPLSHLRSAILLWRRELALLHDMGFDDVETILPLLQQHLGSPLSLSGDKSAVPNVEGMQGIVATLLQQQMMN